MLSGSAPPIEERVRDQDETGPADEVVGVFGQAFAGLDDGQFDDIDV